MSPTAKKKNSSAPSKASRPAKVFMAPTKPPVNKILLSHELVAERAYGNWQKNGCLSNREYEIWLEAEAQIKENARKR